MLSDSLSVARPSVAAQINDVIDHLADKLRVPVSHLYGVLVQQGRASGIVDLVTSLLLATIVGGCLTCAYLAYRRAADSATNADRDYYRSGWTDSRVTTLILGLVGATLLTIILIFTLRDAILELMNPEFYAIQTILGALRGAR